MPSSRHKKVDPRVEGLRSFLANSDELLTALSRGEVDAIVLPGPDGEQIFTLKGAERSYRILLEEMSEGAATVDSTGTLLYCNRRFAQMLRAPLEQVMGSPVLAWVPNEEEATFSAMLGVGSERGTRGETQLRPRDGDPFLIHLSVSALDTDEGPTVCLVATDLSHQKRDRALMASERLARSVLEQATEAVVVCDPEGRITRASAEAHRLCGGNPLLRDFVEAFPLDVSSNALRAILAGEVIRGLTAGLRRDDEPPRTVLLSAGPLCGPDQALLGSIITLTNVTVLHQVQARLEAAVQARDDFLSVASHELRTPLTSLKLQLQGMLRSAQKAAATTGDALARKLQIAVKQTSRLDSLIANLLDVNHLKAGGMDLDLQLTDLQEVVEDVMAQCEQSATDAGCALQLDVAGSAHGMWDRLRLEQVFTNLIANAVKYAPGSPVDVSIGIGLSQAWVDVKDYGIGIAAEDMARIFRRFERAASKRHYGGLGLGLYITQEIVHAMRGSIDVRSVVGQGSTFRVTLPLA